MNAKLWPLFALLLVAAPARAQESVRDLKGPGQYNKFLTSNHLFERLEREALADVALKVERTNETGAFQVSGRGVLHLSVLIEKMRREWDQRARENPWPSSGYIDTKSCSS